MGSILGGFTQDGSSQRHKEFSQEYVETFYSPESGALVSALSILDIKKEKGTVI